MWLLGGSSGIDLTRLVVTFDSLFLQKAEDVVEDEVAVGLLGEEEGLDELSPWLALI